MKKISGIIISLFLFIFIGCTNGTIPNNTTDKTQYKAWKAFTESNTTFYFYIYKLEAPINSLDFTNIKTITEKELINRDSKIINDVLKMVNEKSEYENKLDLIEKNIVTLSSYKKELEKIVKIELDNKSRKPLGVPFRNDFIKPIKYNPTKEVYEITPLYLFNNETFKVTKAGEEVMTNGFGAKINVTKEIIHGEDMRLDRSDIPRASIVIPVKKEIAKNYPIDDLKLEVIVILDDVIKNNSFKEATFNSPYSQTKMNLQYNYKILAYKLLYNNQVIYEKKK